MKTWLHKLRPVPLWAVALVVGIITFTLATWIGSRQSVWFDEAFSIMLAHQPLDTLLHFASVDTHPPLYYLTLKGWMAVFGDGDVALRSLSAACGGVASFAALLLAGRMFGKRIALFTVPFIVLSPFLLRYDFEIRMYAMASMWCVLATYMMIRALQAKTLAAQKRSWGLYALLLLAGAFTFYYCIFVWVAHFIWLALRFRARTRQPELKVPSDDNGTWLTRRPWLIAYTVAFIIFLAWMPTVISQVSNVQGNFWIGPVSYQDVVTIFTFMTSYRPQWQIDPWQSVFIFGGLIASFWLVIGAYHRTSKKNKWHIGLLSLYLFLPIAIMYAISLPPHQPVFLERYATQALMGGYVLIGGAVGILWNKNRLYLYKLASAWVVVLLAAGTVHLFDVGNYNYQQLFKPNYKQTATYITEHLQPHDTVVVDGAGAYIVYAHYLPESQLRFTYNGKELPTTGGYAMLHGSLRRVERVSQLPSRRVWYVYASSRGTVLDMEPDYRQAKQNTFDKTTVTLFEVPHYTM